MEHVITPGSFQLLAIDLNDLGILPKDWIQSIGELVQNYGIKTLLDGTSATSRVESGIGPSNVTIVPGDTIFLHQRWLYDLYSTCFLQHASKLSSSPLRIAMDLTSSININSLDTIGSSYECHVDSNPITGLLFASSLSEEDGGQLVFKTPTNLRITVTPQAGLFLAFDATQTPHFVSPIKSNIRRISIPMNYYTPESESKRPNSLNNYLYTESPFTS